MLQTKSNVQKVDQRRSTTIPMKAVQVFLGLLISWFLTNEVTVTGLAVVSEVVSFIFPISGPHAGGYSLLTKYSAWTVYGVVFLPSLVVIIATWRRWRTVAITVALCLVLLILFSWPHWPFPRLFSLDMA
jgi:hypothetical protein